MSFYKEYKRAYNFKEMKEMDKKNRSLDSLVYDEEGARHIHFQITDAYSSGFFDQEFGENARYSNDINQTLEE